MADKVKMAMNAEKEAPIRDFESAKKIVIECLKFNREDKFPMGTQLVQNI